MGDFWIGAFVGAIASGVFRIVFGRFVVRKSDAGWRWEFDRLDARDRRETARVNEALDTGAMSTVMRGALAGCPFCVSETTEAQSDDA